MIKIKSSLFRSLEPTQVQIVNIYPSYRYGWNDSEKTYKTFSYFPDSATKDVLFQWDAEAIPSDNETRFHLRLQEYDKSVGKFKFTKVAPPNKDFFKTYKKVYDIEVALKSPVTVMVWDKNANREVEYTTSPWEVVRLTAFPASRIQSIAQSMMLTKGIDKVEVDVKDRLTGEVKKEKRLPFNWEDAIVPSMVGKAFEFAVDGTGLDTKYSFKEVSPFPLSDNTKGDGINIEDIPF